MELTPCRQRNDTQKGTDEKKGGGCASALQSRIMSFTHVERDGPLAIVWLDQENEKVNKLSVDLLDEFRNLLDEMERDDAIRAGILISRKPDTFIAGADIERFLDMTEPGQAEELSREGNRLLSRMADFPKPIVAAINGAALGGGLEVAMACHYRIATDHPKTVLGQPEVQLGLLPGGGGTQRLPRLVGLQRALPLLLTGKNIYPYPARKMGLIDLVVPAPTLLESARGVATRLADRSLKRRPRSRGLLDRLLEGNPLGRAVVFRQARKTVLKRTLGNYPAPLKIIDCVRTGYSRGLKAGLEAEAQSFGFLMRTPQCQELVRLFFSMNAVKKNPLASEVRPVERLAVVGAGLMGSGIADISAQRGMQVFLKDVDYAAVGRAEKVIWEGLSRRVKKRALSAFERDRILARVYGTTDYDSLRPAQLVVEAVFEDLQLKRRVLNDVEAITDDSTIFASNTSSLPIHQIAEGCRRPRQVIGMHYFSPVQKMPLLEIVVTDQTADWVQATAIDLGIRQGKTVIVVGDGPGFYTTRILAPMMNEALLLLEEGGRIEEIDKAMRRFGFPVGPLTLMDEVGLDVGAHVTRVLADLFAARGLTATNRAQELVDDGYKGRKNKRGFFLYEGKKKSLNSEIYKHFGGSSRRSIPDSQIQERLSGVMINEAVLCLQEGILRSPRDGDLGAILGLGFPPFLGGPFRYIDNAGAAAIVERFEGLQRVHAPRFEAAPLLREKAAQASSFYRP